MSTRSVLGLIYLVQGLKQLGEQPEPVLARHGLTLHRVEDGSPIPGSFWGEPEAGVIAHNVYVRNDTPVHSMLHEACHLIVLPPGRRALRRPRACPGTGPAQPCRTPRAPCAGMPAPALHHGGEARPHLPISCRKSQG